MQFFMWFLFINSSITSADDQGLFVCLKSSETKEFVIFSVLGIYLTYTTVLGSKLGYVLCQHDVSIKDIFRQFNFNIALYVFNGFLKLILLFLTERGTPPLVHMNTPFARFLTHDLTAVVHFFFRFFCSHFGEILYLYAIITSKRIGMLLPSLYKSNNATSRAHSRT